MTDDAPSMGTVVLPFGRYFASRVDLLTHESFKTCEPISGLSPFAACEPPVADLSRFLDAPGGGSRMKLDIRKDLLRHMKGSGAEYLVVDNTSALLWVQEVQGSKHTVVDERGEFMSWLSGHSHKKPRMQPANQPFADEMRASYDRFIDACLTCFDPSKIILIQSHVPAFFVGEDGQIGQTDALPETAEWLAQLDLYFYERTRCVVSHAALSVFAQSTKWMTFPPSLRATLEKDVLRLMRGDEAQSDPLPMLQKKATATGFMSRWLRKDDVDPDWLVEYFAQNQEPTPAELLGLAALWSSSRAPRTTVSECVRNALAHEGASVAQRTRRRYEKSVMALRAWDWNYVPMPPERSPDRRMVVDTACDWAFVLHEDGRIARIHIPTDIDWPPSRILDDSQVLSPRMAPALLSSWALHIERARRAQNTGPVVSVHDGEELEQSCYWLDWQEVLESERVAIRLIGDRVPLPSAKTDLSFLFDHRTRLVTVGGGLMDQIQHLSLYNRICSSENLRFVIDDFRYIWWRSHNGFEAWRLAPRLADARLSRLVSRPLLERFRNEIDASEALPWLYKQARVWYRFGLKEAVVVSKNHENSRRLAAGEPEFPVLLYKTHDHLRRLMKNPPGVVTLYMSQDGIPRRQESGPEARRLFSYTSLVKAGVPSRIQSVAERLSSTPHVAFHIRRGDYLHPSFDKDGWFSGTEHYREAMRRLVDGEFGVDVRNVAVFSDDISFVRAHPSAYGLDLPMGEVEFVEGNINFDSIFDSYLMSRCEAIVGSVGFFSLMSSLLAESAPAYIRAEPESIRRMW